MHKIMIVEDDAIISASIASRLSNWGCETFCVTDFSRVINDFVEQNPSLILLDVLVAKVWAILRRTYDFGASSGLIEHGGAILNTGNATLTYNDKTIDLTKNDYRILLTLMENKGRVVSRDTLMTKLWETDCYVDENTLTVNVTRLRKKLESYGLKDFIKTKKGIGYIIQ